MNIENEFKYRQQLLDAMQKIINNDVSGDTGVVPDNIALLMADAAWNVLRTVRDCNNYFERESIKP